MVELIQNHYNLVCVLNIENLTTINPTYNIPKRKEKEKKKKRKVYIKLTASTMNHYHKITVYITLTANGH